MDSESKLAGKINAWCKQIDVGLELHEFVLWIWDMRLTTAHSTQDEAYRVLVGCEPGNREGEALLSETSETPSGLES